MGVYTSDNTLHEKVVWQANGRRLSEENFDGENLDELIKIRQYFPRQNFAPYGTWPILMSEGRKAKILFMNYGINFIYAKIPFLKYASWLP